MRRIKRWWWQVVFFLLAVVPGIVLMGLNEQWPLLAISVIGACGLLGLIVAEHCERRKLERENREAMRERRDLKRTAQNHDQRLDDQERRGQQTSHQVEWVIDQQTGSPEPLDAKTTGMAAHPTVIVHDRLVSLATQSLRQRVYWWLVAKSGWVPPWHRG